jgi:uncharacterized protein
MSIDYQKLLDESMMDFIRKVLTKVQHEGLVEDQHFYISFKTNNPFVVLSDRMRKRYPEEITIVLQHYFDTLTVTSEGFSVKLSFDGIPETISVPFYYITSFTDPSVNFSLQFKSRDKSPVGFGQNQRQPDEQKAKPVDKILSSNVIALDKFRDKNKPPPLK